MGTVPPGPAGVLDRPQDTPPPDPDRTLAAAPDVVAPPPGHPRFPLLDSLRALAALGVLAGHVAIFTQNAQTLGWGVLLANLDIGVTVFFVLSGFLLFRPLFSAQLGLAPATTLATFARRRVLRIVPAYWLALTVLAIYPGLPGVFTGDWWRYYGFLQFYSHHTAVRGLGVAWTLCIEVAFYAVLPLYAWLTGRVGARLSPGGRVRLQLTVLALLSIGSVLLRIDAQSDVMQNSLLTHWLWFALGMTLAVTSVALQRGQRAPSIVRLAGQHPGWCWAAAVVVYLGMCAVLSSARAHLYLSVSQETCQHLMSALFALLVVAPAVLCPVAAVRPGETVSRDSDPVGWPLELLALRPLALLGLISYGIYLWHASLALTLIRHHVQQWLPLLLFDLALTIAIAAASYLLLERPLLRAKRRRAPRLPG
jgi:peptidoglycan/LPS O-acetylase OafA/YrhL